MEDDLNNFKYGIFSKIKRSNPLKEEEDDDYESSENIWSYDEFFE